MKENESNNMKEQNLSEESQLTPEQENELLKEQLQLMNLKESMKDNEVFKMFMIEQITQQNQLLMTIMEKMKIGLNSMNQQLYSLSKILIDKDSVRPSPSPNTIQSIQQDIYEPVVENNIEEEEEVIEEPESPDYNEEIEKLENDEKTLLRELEKRRMELKKKAKQDDKLQKLEDYKITREEEEQKRMEARAKLKAEELLIKQNIMEKKSRIGDIPKELADEFREKYGRF